MKRLILAKGMEEILPAKLRRYYNLINIINDVSRSYGYKMIKTPLIERKELFHQYDDNSFYFKDLENEDLVLKSNGVLPLLRTVVVNKLYLDPDLPLKFSYLDETFKYYYPGKEQGNSWNFEYGFESIGEDSNYTKAEIILLATRILNFLGFEEVKVNIRNISLKNFKQLEEILSFYKINYERKQKINNSSKLYSEFIFEIELILDSKKVVVAKGGGHSSIVNSLGKRNLNSFGFSLDLVKLLDLLEKDEFFQDIDEDFDFYVYSESDKSLLDAQTVALMLRDLGAKVDVNYLNIEESVAFKSARRKNVSYVIIVDQNFAESDEVKILNMVTNHKEKVKLIDFIEELKFFEEEEEENEKNT